MGPKQQVPRRRLRPRQQPSRPRQDQENTASSLSQDKSDSLNDVTITFHPSPDSSKH